MQLNATGVGGAGAGGLGVASPAGGSSGTGGAGGAGGQGVGGVITVNAGVANGTLLISNLGVDAGASGGAGGDGGFSSTGTGGTGGAGGSAIAGTVQFDTNGALAGMAPTGRMQLGALNVAATGYGGAGGAGGSGAQLGVAGAGGAATGGFVTVRADRGGSLIQVDGAASILADGYGATGVGSTSGVDGGKGTGGAILFTADGTTSGNQIKLATLYADASGLGGASLTAPGGEGVGGSMNIVGGAGLAISASGLTLRAIGFGGQASSSFTGGAATGGLVSVDMRGGSTLAATGSVLLDASSVGGASSQTAATGGAATGGTASLLTTGGGITLDGDVTVQANAFGGDAGSQGLGGAALGGLALLSAGNLDRQGNGGSLTVVGNAGVYADGYGGGGFNGGRGAGGTASVTGRLGTVTLGSANVSGSGGGGAGFGGGAGGDGAGGEASVLTFNTPTGEADIAIGPVSLAANGQGGAGGTGFSNGGVGGAGGTGLGGNVLALGSAGNGRITLGDLTAVAEGRGGAGGVGGSNDGGIGGDGGVGGAGLGGAIQIGTQSGADTGALNIGAGNFAQVYAFAGGNGGTGGTGGSGPGGAGAGGAGGDATGGGATLLVRGSPVTLSGNGLFLAVASGGDGGAGSVQGAGGNATVGLVTGTEALVGAHLELTSRYLVDAQRGSLNAGVLSFQAIATGGQGSTNGTSTTLGSPIAFNVRNGDLTAQSIALFAPGQGPAGAIASPLTMQNANAVIAGGFDFITGGDLVVSLDNANLSADHAQISGQNWIESGNVVATPGAIHTNGQLYLYSGGDIVGDASLITAADLSVNAPGSIRLNELSAGGPLYVSAGQSITLGNLSGNASIRVLGGGTVSIGAVQANGGVDLSAGGGALTVAGSVAAVDGAVLNASDVVNAGDITVMASNASSLRELSVFANGAMTLGDLDAGATRLFGTQAITTGSIRAGDLAVLAGGDIALGSIAASGRVLLADVVMTDAGGSSLGLDALFAASPARATGAIAIAGPVVAASFTAATSRTLDVSRPILVSGDVSLDAAGAITFDNLSAGGAATITGDTAVSGVDIVAGSLALTTGGALLLGTIATQAGAVDLAAAGALATGAITANGGVSAISSGGALSLGDVLAAGDVTLGAGGAIHTDSLSAEGNLTISAVDDFAATSGAILGGPLTPRTVTAGGAITIASSAGGLTMGPVSATSGAIDLRAPGSIAAGGVTAGTDVSVVSNGGGLVLGDVQAGTNLTLRAGASALSGALTAGGDVSVLTVGDLATLNGGVAGGGAAPLGIAAGGSVSIASSAGGLTLGAITAGSGAVDLAAFGAISGGSLTAGTNLRVQTSAGDIVLGTVAASAGSIDLLAGGALTTQDISAYGGIAAQARTSMSLGNLAAATGNVALDAGGALSGLDIVAGQGAITLDAVGDAGLQLVSAFGPVTGSIRGDATFQTVASQGQGVQLAAGGTLTVSRSVLATTDIALVAGNDIALGLAVGRNLALLADGNVTAGRLVAGTFDPNGGATPGNGGILVAGRAMLDGGGQIGTLDVAALLSQAPARVAGTIAIGSAAGGSFATTSSGDIFAGQIDASSTIKVDTSGVARVGGRWAGPSITLSSRDLVIATQSASGAPVGLDAGVSGSILLRSISEQGVVLGDGVGQSEYNISAAEWATIRSGSLTIRALDTANAIDIRIGNLEVTGPDAGSTIDDPNGVVRFQTVNPDGISGAIRISGNLSTRGFRATNALEFDTERFELDAGTGSLGVYGTGGALSGILRINADGIHVASGAILDKIAADPFYTALEADLDQPATVQRPDGVLAAGAFRFVVGSTFYVQNTGTAVASAGFLTAADGFSILPGTTTRPVRMIVNGKFTDGTTVLSGTQAYDAFKANQQQLTIFDGESRIEGCLLIATSCGAMTDVPVEVVGPTISTQITILGQNGLGDTPRFVDTPDTGSGGDGGDGSTPEQQEQADKATAGPPIVPPTPLIDMRPLNPPGRIEEPVAGSGNPALMGAFVNENSAEGAQ
ncbi:beta strand repeat-containing protein [Novosphingobium sp.]|uniref:beta strand repeat-containing protein n=1 Tax=Novosphingobium sp. TaxID=1874826 RepID=UPI0038BAB077